MGWTESGSWKAKTVENRLTPSHHHFLHPPPPLPSPPLQSDSKTKRLSSHFEGLLADREALIEQLATQESTLKHALEDKAQAERKLKEERQRLISVGVWGGVGGGRAEYWRGYLHAYISIAVNIVLMFQLSHAHTPCHHHTHTHMHAPCALPCPSHTTPLTRLIRCYVNNWAPLNT